MWTTCNSQPTSRIYSTSYPSTTRRHDTAVSQLLHAMLSNGWYHGKGVCSDTQSCRTDHPWLTVLVVCVVPYWSLYNHSCSACEFYRHRESLILVLLLRSGVSCSRRIFCAELLSKLTISSKCFTVSLFSRMWKSLKYVSSGCQKHSGFSILQLKKLCKNVFSRFYFDSQTLRLRFASILATTREFTHVVMHNLNHFISPMYFA